jgi:predicted aldo/keto reductase-like oxidoreductase
MLGAIMRDFILNPILHAEFGDLGSVCRLGLATRGNTHLEPEAVLHSVQRGVNYLNWCGVGHADGMTEAVRRMGEKRKDVLIASQFFARDAEAARRELDEILGELDSEYIDVLTYYYVEQEEEWAEIIAPDGAHSFLMQAKAEGKVRSIGLTSHQRDLAAAIATRGEVDMLMVRYNAAHRGPEEDVFPAAKAAGVPVVTYTSLRWGGLLKPTPDDPPEYVPASAPEWYRFVLCHPGVTVGLMAPDGDDELAANLALLDDWHGCTIEAYNTLREHGDRVYKHAGYFP